MTNRDTSLAASHGDCERGEYVPVTADYPREVAGERPRTIEPVLQATLRTPEVAD